MRTRVMVMCASLLILATACGDPDLGSEPGATADSTLATVVTDETSGSTVAPPATEDATTTTAPADTGTTVEPADPAEELPESLEVAVEAARQDLAAELAIDPSEIEIVSAEDIEWPDASLGCPEPGGAYAQVVTPGTHIVLKAQGASFSYHGVEGGIPVVCDSPQIPPPVR